MLTQTEINRLFEQVNKAFEADRERINALEKRVKDLDNANKGAPKQSQTAKGN
jgi:polyhydroxyalkanoate synthesis regulator phasin